MLCVYSLQWWEPAEYSTGVLKGLGSVGPSQGPSRMCLGLYKLAAVDGFKGHTGWEAVGSNGVIWCLAHQILPVSDWGWQLRAPATGRTPSGLTCTFGCHGYYCQVVVVCMVVVFYVVALIMKYKANINEKKEYLKMHSTDFKEVRFTCHEQCFIACENSCLMSSVAMEGVSLTSEGMTLMIS